MATSTHVLLPIFPEESWVREWFRIRVGYVWTGKFDLNTDTWGRGKFHSSCSGTCLLLKTAQDSRILQKILARLVLEFLFTLLYCIRESCAVLSGKRVPLQWKLLAASWISINGRPSFFLQNVLNDLLRKDVLRNNLITCEIIMNTWLVKALAWQKRT